MRVLLHGHGYRYDSVPPPKWKHYRERCGMTYCSKYAVYVETQNPSRNKTGGGGEAVWKKRKKQNTQSARTRFAVIPIKIIEGEWERGVGRSHHQYSTVVALTGPSPCLLSIHPSIHLSVLLSTIQLSILISSRRNTVSPPHSSSPLPPSPYSPLILPPINQSIIAIYR